MENWLLEEFKSNFHYSDDEIDRYRQTGQHSLTIYLTDGSRVLYDDISKTCRTLPASSRNMTEQECMKEFGYRLKSIMRGLRINQTDLSEITGISQTVISNYINGRTTPGFYNVDRIAKALGCSVDDFRYYD